MANLTLNTVVYNGLGVVNSLASWVARGTGIAAGFAWVKARVNLDPDNLGQKNGSKYVRIRWNGNIPILATADSSCACTGEVLRFSDFDITIRAAADSTTAERTDLALRLKDLTASTEFQSSVINLQQPVG